MRDSRVVSALGIVVHEERVVGVELVPRELRCAGLQGLVDLDAT